MCSADVTVRTNAKLLEDHDTKDLEIMMSDGKVLAHSVYLMAASDAIRSMLNHGSAAISSKKQLSWKEHSLEVGRFVLRLLYTGTVDETEWTECIDDRESSGPEGVPVRLLVTSPNGKADCVGMYELVTGCRPNGHPIWKKSEPDRWIYGSGSPVQWGIVTQAIKDTDFPPNKGHIRSIDAKRITPDRVPRWQRHMEGVGFTSDSEISVVEPELQVPLRLLLGALAISKMYLFTDLLATILDALKARLTPDNFDAICRASIREDATALRLYCVQHAQNRDTGIYELYKAGTLSPEVQIELAGVWKDDVSSVPPLFAKRRKL